MYSKNKLNLIISEVAGEEPTLEEMNANTIAFNIADNIWFKEDHSVSPVVIKKMSSTPRSYTAFIDQAGTAAPTASIIQSSFPSGRIWFEYTGVGEYTIKSDGRFTEDKTIPSDDVFMDSAGNTFEALWVDVNTIGLISKDPDGVKANDLIVNRYIHIEVFE